MRALPSNTRFFSRRKEAKDFEEMLCISKLSGEARVLNGFKKKYYLFAYSF
ncbi:MAG: hypothetical protein ACOYJD_02175 [Christensenellales bacterium]